MTAAILPHPPLLIPEIAAGAASELDDLRHACRSAVEELRFASPDRLVVVGAGATQREYAMASDELPKWQRLLRSFGVEQGGKPQQPDLGKAPQGEELPLPLAIAAWLLEQSRWQGEVLFCSVPAGLTGKQAAKLGQRLTEGEAAVAMLAMGDGSAALSERAPAYLAAGAQEWQTRAAAALTSADMVELLRLTAADAELFAVAGLSAWQVLAGAAGDREWSTTLWADEAPYGVAYTVASWALTS